MSKIALVTGGTKGIGRAISLQLAEDGYDLIVIYSRDQAAADDFVKRISSDFPNTKYSIYKADISNEESVSERFNEISKKYEKIDVLVNNAGMDIGKLFEDYKLSEIRNIVEVNVFGTMYVTRLSLELLKKSRSGVIVNIASRMGGDKHIETVAPYGAAKAAVVRFTKLCALEFRKYKIRCLSISPGLTDTELTRRILSEEDFRNIAASNPTGRNGNPEDIAHLVSFLVSEKASHINAEDIRVDGGSFLI